MEDKKVQEFHNAYINADKEGLEKLWEKGTPKSLIKFYSGKYEPNGSNYLLDSISNNTLWLSSPRFFNDPFDCIINVNYNAEAENISRKFLSERFGDDVAKCLLSYGTSKEVLENIANYLKAENEGRHLYLEKSIFVACLSEKDNLKSSRMWAHYANNHSGVCVEYDFDAVKNTSPFGCIPVRYTDDYRYLLNTNNISEDVANYMQFFTKAKEWEYEAEWRVAEQNKHLNMMGYNVPISSPIAVYLGCKVSKKLKKDVVTTCKNIPVYQMGMIPGTFQFDYKLCTR